jgi:peptidyl-prolyl isomerase D
VRKIENLPTQGSDKPTKDVTITNCGELTGDEAEEAVSKTADYTGDAYEDFPEDQNATLTAKEIVTIATNLKEYGNTAFKKGDLSLGLDKYQKGLRYLNEDPELKDEPPETKKLMDAMRFTLNSNSALLSNKLKDFEGAHKYASDALEVADVTANDKAKALYRRAIASEGLKDEDSALADLDEALKHSPEDPAIKKELVRVKKAAAERAKKEKAAYSKFFS